ncbi:MAG: hypothetical protein Q8O32_02105 [bacterium]|nr:hypothetical protein [bacterium]
MEEKNMSDTKDIEENKLLAALGYIWVLCFIPLLLKRKSKFSQFHAKQGLVLFIIEIIGTVVFPIPVIGWALFILVILLAILGAKSALDGEYWEMPFFGKLVKKLNL